MGKGGIGKKGKAGEVGEEWIKTAILEASKGTKN